MIYRNQVSVLLTSLNKMEHFNKMEHLRPHSLPGYKRVYNRLKASWFYSLVPAPTLEHFVQWDFCNDEYIVFRDEPTDGRPLCQPGYKRVHNGSEWIYQICKEPEFDTSTSFLIWDPTKDEYAVLNGLENRPPSRRGSRRFYKHEEDKWVYYFVDFPDRYNAWTNALIWNVCNDEYITVPRCAHYRLSKAEKATKCFSYLMFLVEKGHQPH